MKLYKVFLIALLMGTFALIGCGGSGDASSVCDACDVSSLKGACENTYNICIQEDAGSSEDCKVAALLVCGAV